MHCTARHGTALTLTRNCACVDVTARLRGEQKRFLEHTLRDFKRNGLALEKKVRDEVKDLQSKMSALSIRFAQNLGEEDTKFEFTAAQLAGVPAALLAGFKKNGDKYIVTIRYPDYFRMCLCPVTRPASVLSMSLYHIVHCGFDLYVYSGNEIMFGGVDTSNLGTCIHIPM
jgi:hypothetical protein